MVFAHANDCNENAYLHCMLPGHLQVDMHKLNTIAGAECRMVESDELQRVTGARVGGVHPFVPGVSKRFLDKRVLRIAADGQSLVSFNTGDMTKGVLLKCEALLQALGDQACVVDLAVSEQEEEYEAMSQELHISVSNARFLRDNEFALGYFRSCLKEEQATEGNLIIDWMRTMVRFAGQTAKDPSTVEPCWLLQLACRHDATKYAREEALKQYLISGQQPPGMPEAAAAGGSAEKRLDAIIAETLTIHSAAISKLGADGLDSKNGKKLITFLMGEVMKRSGGSFNPAHVKAVLIDGLAQSRRGLV
jgi:prolyl-tRNA editing enzyme YbaK/EbsC (Cys-tRNA(Pro) deacylase)